MKSPLRYPGGKSRAVKELIKYIPSDLDFIVSPFFGGGSLELALEERSIFVYGYDIFSPLVDFWQCLIENPKKLANLVKENHPLSKKDFYELQSSSFSDKFQRAAIFYVLNRSSFSGSTLSGGMSPGHPRFNQNSIDRISSFIVENLSVSHSDYKDVFEIHGDCFYYLDPPYFIKNNLYGKNGDIHKNFDHDGLFQILKNKTNWILSYNNCPEVLEKYKDYEIKFPEWKYGMSKDKDSKEVLIFSRKELSEK